MSVNILGKSYDIKTTTKIFLGGLNLSAFPDSICSLINLQVLDLQNNNLTNIPSEIGSLTKLRSLNLINNKLTSLPDSFGKLVNLEIIILTSNCLTQLPNSFMNLTKLNALYLINNNLTSLPALGNLPKLNELYLRRNKLTILPPSIKNIPHVSINSDGYQIDNLDQECEFIMINSLDEPLTNLPIGLKEIWLTHPISGLDAIKIPFGCKVYINARLQN